MGLTRRAPGDPAPGDGKTTGREDVGDGKFLATSNAAIGKDPAEFRKGLADHRRRSPQARTPAPAPMPIDHWSVNPDSWDVVSLDGVPLPGVCEVDAATQRKIDAKSAPGADGGTVRDKGYDLAKFKVTVRIWTPGHLEFWVRLAPLIDPRRRGRERRPTAITHPGLYLIGITQAYITGVSALKASGHAKGVRESVISFVEYAPATPPTRSVTRTAQAAGAAATDAFGELFVGKPGSPAPSTPASDTGP